MVSMLLCQRESYVREAAFEVLASGILDKLAATPSPKPNSPPPRTPSPACDARMAWVETADSVLFAESGGQPGDRGAVVDARGRCLPCVAAERREGRVRHMLALEGQEEMPPAAGESVTVRVDWERRYDHMQQHTAQHLFSALAHALRGLVTVGWALHADRTVVELAADALTAEDVAAVENAANEAIRSRAEVTAEIVPRDKLHSIPLLRSRGATPTEGDLRVVTIAGLDASTCGGTHVANTAELQALQVLDTARGRRGTVRVSFLAGGRVLRHAAAVHERERTLGRLLCCEPEGIVARAEATLAEVTSLTRQRKRLCLDLAQHVGTQLVADAQHGGDVVCALHCAGADMDFLQAVAAVAADALTNRMLLLTASESPEEGASGPGVFLVVGPPALVQCALPVVLRELHGKGGGKGGRAQGRCTAVEQHAAAVTAVRGTVAAK
eukprot:TRINITY_DN7958_c0_g1_i1.p1 TRINITY_DN7958_c0_g1~~TRINITY_DN7958_c0_g1_i1.p1  ORF type:complete len:450 (-),score=118.48 TRINITY_DN7958_c0_g1_i1:71-1396(-)